MNIQTEPRIVDGLCPVNCTCTASTPRVSSSYKEGKGDKRVIIDDEGLLQDLLFIALEDLRFALLDTLPDTHKDIQIFMKWLINSTYSLSALIHCIHKGELIVSRHTLPNEVIDYFNLYLETDWPSQTNTLMQDIIEWKELLGSKQEFGHYPTGEGAKVARGLDNCRSKARMVQTLFRAWRSHYEEVGGHAETLNQTLIFLNRLSTYFEWAARYEAHLKGIEVELWESQMPAFPNELKTF